MINIIHRLAKNSTGTSCNKKQIGCCFTASQNRRTRGTVSTTILDSPTIVLLFSTTILLLISSQPSSAFLQLRMMTTTSRKQQPASSSVTVGSAFQNSKPILPDILPTSKRLFLVRHGEVINPGGPNRQVFYGGDDVPLSPLGKLEAMAAAQYLKDFPLQLVASSPLSRALYGAQQVVQALESTTTTTTTPHNNNNNNNIFIHDGFRELNRGSWSGKTAEEIGYDRLERFNNCDLTVTPDGGGESYLQLKDRVLEAYKELLQLTDNGKASALVSHLQVTRALLSDALNLPPNRMASLKISTASVTCIDYCTLGGPPIVHFQSWKPQAGLQESIDGAN